MPTFFFKNMIQLYTNTADQEVILTLQEGKSYYPTAFNNYLIIITREERTDGGLDLAQIPTVEFDSERYTRLSLTTVGLTTPGRYRYVVYGQNSNSNLDPTDGVVVGEIEQGWFNLITTDTYWNDPTLSIDNDIIAGE